MIIEVGEKIHVITRRNFTDDLRRHFVGVVQAIAGDTVRLQGYTFVFNPNALEYRRRPELRTRIFGLADSQLIVNVLPNEVKIESFQYVKWDGRLVVTDGSAFSLDINEFGVVD